MDDKKMLDYIKEVLENIPSDWLKLTTHRLDIYEEKLAKVQFLDAFEILFNTHNFESSALNALPTAFDYIRLGHPLSCVLEWVLAKLNNINAAEVISFSSKTIPILSVLRKNLFDNKNTQIFYTGVLPPNFDAEIIRKVYGYTFELHHVEDIADIPASNDCTIFIEQKNEFDRFDLLPRIDFFIHNYAELGSVLFVNGTKNESYISAIQHVRRRETIAMTPANCQEALRLLTSLPSTKKKNNIAHDKKLVIDAIQEITQTETQVLVSSSGLSIQYAILMGFIHQAEENHKGKAIKIIVPPNCYGGTNDQSRRVAACLDHVEVLDMAVDGGNDMVQSIDTILDQIAAEDAVPYIIAEIPTNPRVEVPDLQKLKAVLSKARQTSQGELAVDPVFILDQTFCPNVHFLGEGELLSSVRTISFASGSKFPSGGLCTAGYCVGNKKAEALMAKVETHLRLCDNEATPLQLEILAQQLPSMKQRISDAYQHTRDFVNFINETLPAAKINFVSEALAKKGFTPSVFSLDLPSKGNTAEEKEAYKRALNYTLINLMIKEIPTESKNCVSYGQLKGCYWTIPATSTQGTTKEGDKDYIVRVALSPNMDLALHKKVFLDFVEKI